MKLLGIDPGTLVMGYGLINLDRDEPEYLCCGVVKTRPRASLAQRLGHLHRELTLIIAEHAPDAVAVEQPFVGRNTRTALAIGQAQAVALVAAANHDIPVFQYTPTQVKQRVASYGHSSKEQVQEMVRLQLGLATAPEPHDAADALAVALCHAQEMHLNQLTANR